MRLLLDTHILIWIVTGDVRLTDQSEGVKIVSHDRQFPQYGEFVIKV